ncbi:hypothetical protein KGQ19_16135 [Catenulispora sp. NL8]|uniref:Uncharacterized protein n=1 Tax=Catenulispora pinistramenti TaxID=2705254 RepID=A0ABS5KQR9_9ACTN|nr:hypothetical protein [Catenulispora pinistramenti]MBS2548396.1 hypothetical protein [Catenulispora pinistramenti]
MAKPPLARITGVAIAPGVSRNNRLYTSQNIGRLVERANTRINSGDSPITMRTHYGAGDDSTRIVGRVTRLWQDETGAARYEGEIADAGHGPTIAGLLPTSESDTTAALRGVSIRGRWASPPRKATTDNGQAVETADDLEIDGLDFTATPGVAGAHAVVVSAADVPNVPPAPPNSGKSWETSVEFGLVEAAPDAEVVETTDPAELAPAVAERAAPVAYADRGDYLSDGAKRYPLDTREHAKQAWLALRETEVARQYTAAQLKRVRGRAVKALTEFGVYTDPAGGWLIEAPTRVIAEDVGDGTPGFGGAYRICLTNGPTEVSVSCYQLDPHDLDAVGRAAMTGAIAAIKAIDPDLDADIDIPSDGTEAAPAAPAVEPGPPTSAAPDPAPDSPDPVHEEDDAVAEEPTNPTAGSTPADTAPAAAAATAAGEPDKLDKLTDMIGKLVAAIAPTAPAAAPAPVETAPAAPVAEAAATPTPDQLALLAGLIGSPAGAAAMAQAAAAQTAAVQAQAGAVPPPVAETEDQRIARLVSEQVTVRVQDLVESGQLGGGRKGLTATAPAVAPGVPSGAALNENGLPEGWPNKPLHEYSEAEFSRYAFPQLENYVLNGRVPRA